eukprot:Selendium_serpulae@DN6158_c0_g1_i2.p1
MMASDFVSYICTLPTRDQTVRDQIYENVAVVQAVFKSLTAVCQMVVIRMLYIDRKLGRTFIATWLFGDLELATTTRDHLTQLGILCWNARPQSPNDGTTVEVAELHPYFQRSMMSLISGGLQQCKILSTPSKRPKHVPTIFDLHRHAVQKWNNLLLWVSDRSARADLRGQRHVIPPSKDLETILQRKGLVGVQMSAHRKCDSAFNWLLEDLRHQLNSIVICFFEQLQLPTGSGNENMVGNNPNSAALKEALIFTAAISQASIGQACSTSELTATQRRAFLLFIDLGLIWVHKSNKPDLPKHYFTTTSSRLLQHESIETRELSVALDVGRSEHPQAESGALDEIKAAVRVIPLSICHPIVTSLDNHEELDRSLMKTSAFTDRGSPLIPADRIRGMTTNDPSEAGVHLFTTEAGVIVESNFKVFMYTASQLQRDILANFCVLRVVTPLMVVGVMTRHSIQEAYCQRGITAEQIIRFLETHAHQVVFERHRNTGKPLLPENVMTQLKMWEGERRRLNMTRASVFEFNSDLDLFPSCVGWAKTLKCLLTYTPYPGHDEASNLSPEEQAAQFEAWKEKKPKPVIVVKRADEEEFTWFLQSRDRLKKGPIQQPLAQNQT